MNTGRVQASSLAAAAAVNPLESPESFVQRVTATPRFRANGFVRGSAPLCCWAVVDPVRHPMYVWRKVGVGLNAYARSAGSLDAVVFTNGPLMGKRVGIGTKVTRRSSIAGVVAAAALAAGGAYALGRVADRTLAWSVAGGLLAGATTARRVLTDWVPCGDVVGVRHGARDYRDFDGEGGSHSWFGRFGSDFGSYRVGSGQPPRDLLEGMGGLISIVRDHRVPAASPGARGFDADFAALGHKRGAAAWALVDLPARNGVLAAGAPAADGVIVVFGSRRLRADTTGRVLVDLGARDAVAMDPRASVVLGADGGFAIGPPPIHRQLIEEYGMYCA